MERRANGIMVDDFSLEKNLRETLQHIKEDDGFGLAEVKFKEDATVGQLCDLKARIGIDPVFFQKNDEEEEVFQFNLIDCVDDDIELEGTDEDKLVKAEIIYNVVQEIVRSGIVERFTARFEIWEEKTINIVGDSE